MLLMLQKKKEEVYIYSSLAMEVENLLVLLG